MAKMIKAKSNYTRISNVTMQTKTLSTDAKGMLGVLLSMPDNWNFSIAGIAKTLVKEGKDAVRTMLNELEDKHYLVRKQLKDKRGRFGRNVYFISDLPLTQEEVEALMKKHGYKPEDFVDDSISLPLSDNPSTVEQSAETPTQINNKKTKKKKQIYSSISQSPHNSNLTQETENDSQIHDEVTEQEIDKILSKQAAEPMPISNAVQCDTAVSEDHVDDTPVHFDSEEFKKQIGYDKLNRNKPTYSGQFKALVNVIGGVLSSKDKMRVSGRVISPQLASERFSKLRYDHVMHVLETYNKRVRDEKKPNDPRAYLLTMLYNSVDESDDDFMSAFGKAAPEHESSFDIEDLYGLVNNFPGYDYVPDTSCESSNADFYIQAFSEKMNQF